MPVRFGVQSRIESAGAEGLTDDDPAKSKWDASDANPPQNQHILAQEGRALGPDAQLDLRCRPTPPKW